MRLHWAAIAFGVALFVLPTTGRAESGKSVARAIYDTYEDRADGWKASLTRNVKSAAALLALPFLPAKDEAKRDQPAPSTSPACRKLATACLAGETECADSGLRCLTAER